MNGPRSDGSPLDTAAGAAGPQATEAFKRLGNETRLAILLALWEAYEPFGDDNAVPFSTLRERVGMRDKGQFYYHLDRLVGHFVRRTDDGYELRNAGRKIVRTIIAGTGFEEVGLPRTAIDKRCPHCGAQTAITYENEWLYQVCTECRGTFRADADVPPGTLTVWPFAQAGLADRTPEEVFAAGTLLAMRQYALMVGGVCPECCGGVDAWLDVCVDHGIESDPGTGSAPDADPESHVGTESQSICSTCDRRYAVQARFVCTVCKNKMWGPPSILVGVHPRVVGFYADHGVELGYDSADLSGAIQFTKLIREHDSVELVAEDPLQVRVTFRCEGERLRLTLDERLAVLDVDRSG